MRILLVGNVGCISETLLAAAFAEDQVTILGKSALRSTADRRLVVMDWPDNAGALAAVFDARDFDFIFYFSSSLTMGHWETGELERLDRLLETDFATEDNARFVYLCGPGEQEIPRSGRSVLSGSAEDLVHHYAAEMKLRTSVIRMPWLCSVHAEDDPIAACIAQIAAGTGFDLPGPPQQPVSFLSESDLAELLYRLVDRAEEDRPIYESMQVPECFSLTMADLGVALSRLAPGVEPRYAPCVTISASFPQDDGQLRHTCHWFPRVSILEDLPDLLEAHRGLQSQKVQARKSLFRRLQDQPTLIRILELLLGFAVAEALTAVMGSFVQFRMVDLRLLFVVLMGSMYGMDMGLSAAGLASLALMHAYQQEGTSWLTLFYELSNWVPFIAYAIAGAACGYLRMRSKEDIAFLQQENDIAREKYEFINCLYGDALHDKREYKKRIIGTQDSFGKIFDVTRQLDVVHPQEIFIKAIQVMENVLGNRSICLYSLGSHNRSFARLEVASRDVIDHAPRSIQMKDYALAMAALKTEEVWVNTALTPGYPMYIAAIRQGLDEPVMLIFVEQADPSQMNLYYKNLLKILAGLVEAALLRAVNYRREVRAKQYIGDTQIMNAHSFLETLRLRQDMQERRIAQYTLLKLDAQGRTLIQADEALHGKIRENDYLGVDHSDALYLILNQTEKAHLPLVIGRLERAGFVCALMQAEETERLLQQPIAD